MRYQALAEACRDLSGQAAACSRLEMVARLAALLRATPAASLGKVTYLCQGKVAPDFAGVEIGLSEKLATRRVAQGLGVDPGRVLRGAGSTLAQRAQDAAEALRRLGGTCAAEYKYGGARAQVHRLDGDFRLYSRRLEPITGQYPDAIELLRGGLKPRRRAGPTAAPACLPGSGPLPRASRPRQ